MKLQRQRCHYTIGILPKSQYRRSLHTIPGRKRDNVLIFEKGGSLVRESAILMGPSGVMMTATMSRSKLTSVKMVEGTSKKA